MKKKELIKRIKIEVSEYFEYDDRFIDEFIRSFSKNELRKIKEFNFHMKDYDDYSRNSCMVFHEDDYNDFRVDFED